MATLELDAKAMPKDRIATPRPGSVLDEVEYKGFVIDCPRAGELIGDDGETVVWTDEGMAALMAYIDEDDKLKPSPPQARVDRLKKKHSRNWVEPFPYPERLKA